MVPEWVEACDAAGEWVDARQYLLKDRAAEARDGFNLASVYEAAQRRRLLDGIGVFLTPGAPARVMMKLKPLLVCSCADEQRFGSHRRATAPESKW